MPLISAPDPSDPRAADLRRLDGDIPILGVAGKMGPTRAPLARRAAPDKRIVRVARFSDAGVRERLRTAVGSRRSAAMFCIRPRLTTRPRCRAWCSWLCASSAARGSGG